MAQTILVVDDSASIRSVIAMALKGAGYQIIDAADGEEAIAKLQTHRVQLIITDVNMPKMDGITMTRQIRQLPTCRFVPIVMLTTESQPERMKEGQEAGAKAWLVKPFRPDQLLTVVLKVLGV